MKKNILAIVFAVFCVTISFSVSYGGVLSEKIHTSAEPKLKSQKDSLENDINASAWLRVPLSVDGSSYFVTEGYYNANWKKSSEETENVLDLSLLKFSFQKSFSDTMNGTFDFGRFSFSDATNCIFTQISDGIFASVELPLVIFSAYVGYTGLLNAKSTLYNTVSTNGQDKDDLYAFDDPFLIAETSVSFPNLIGSQSISAEYLCALDLDNDFNRMYTTAALSGPVVNMLFYQFSSTLGFSQIDSSSDWQVANLSKGSLMLFPEGLITSLSLDGVFASGDKNSLDAFQTFTPGSASIAGHTWSDVIRLGLSCSIKPTEKLLFTGYGNTLFVVSDGNDYDGFEWHGEMSWQLLSDFSINCSATEFIPQTGESTLELKLSSSLAL